MNKLFAVLVFLLLAIPGVSFAGTISKPANNLGLIGYWPMNEGTGTQAGDSSGRSNSGTFAKLTGSDPTWAVGRFGSAVQFDAATGSNTGNWVDMGNITAMNGLTSVTITAWVKSSDNSYNHGAETYFAGKSDCTGLTGDGPFELFKNQNADSPGFSVYPSGSSVFQSNDATTNIDDGNWHFLVGKYDNNTISIWVDGKMENSNTIGAFTLSNTAKKFEIGNCVSSIGWTGPIDEVRVYNRALSTTEIGSLYKSGAAGFGASSANLDAGSTLGSGLVGHWTFDGADITTSILDKSGNGNNGGWTGSATTSARAAGKLGQAFTFNGTSNYVDAGANMGQTGTMTTCAWVNATSLASANERHIIARSNLTSDQYILHVDSTGAVVFAWGPASDTGRVTSSPVITLNSWFHVCASRGTTAGSVHIYLNGVEQTSSSLGGGSAIPSISASTIIGDYEPSAGCTDCFWKGKIDDVRIYNRALSTAEIFQLYNLGSQKINTSSQVLTNGSTLTSGLVGHWTFDGADTPWTSPTVGTTLDKSGNGNTGTLNNLNRATAVTPGKIGQALTFNGSASYINLGTPAALNNISNQSYSAWIKPDSSAALGISIYSKASNGSQPADAPTILIDLSGTYCTNCVAFSTGFNGNTQTNTWMTPNSSITLGQWAHVVVVYDRSASASDINTAPTIYINGVAQTMTPFGTNASGAGTPDDDSGFPAFIGAYGTTGFTAAFFKGVIDDMRIYNKLLTASEAKQLYNLGR